MQAFAVTAAAFLRGRRCYRCFSSRDAAAAGGARRYLPPAVPRGASAAAPRISQRRRRQMPPPHFSQPSDTPIARFHAAIAFFAPQPSDVSRQAPMKYARQPPAFSMLSLSCSIEFHAVRQQRRIAVIEIRTYSRLFHGQVIAGAYGGTAQISTRRMETITGNKWHGNVTDCNEMRISTHQEHCTNIGSTEFHESGLRHRDCSSLSQPNTAKMEISCRYGEFLHHMLAFGLSFPPSFRAALMRIFTILQRICRNRDI